MAASVARTPHEVAPVFRGRLLRLRSDDQLVALFRLGHDDAFAVVHERYRRRLLGYCRRMVAGSGLDPEDVLQDVLVRAYSALRGDDRPVTLRAWLFRVAHNRCIDLLRRPVPAPAEVAEVLRGPDIADPADRAERRERLHRLVTDVGRLPEQQRSALIMREVHGLSHAELADALGVTVPAIKSLLVRARTGLVAAREARDTACADIRAELLHAGDRGVRCSGRARRHVSDCRPCRRFQATLDGDRSRVAALLPGPLGALAAALGGGGTGGGAVAAGVAVVKVAAVVSTVAVVSTGAVEVHDRVTTPHAGPAPAPAAVRPAPVPAARSRLPAPAAPARAAAEAGAGANRRLAPRRAAVPGVMATDAVIDVRSGGAEAPDEDALGSGPAATGGGHAVAEAPVADEPRPELRPARPALEAIEPVLPGGGTAVPLDP